MSEPSAGPGARRDEARRWHVPALGAMAELAVLMDRLRSPDGCPWDREQTHASLAPFAIEEAHELVEAIESGDRAHVREELGDVLLQVVFHARIAAEHPSDPFDLDDVARGIADKLVRRHPHVFSDVVVDGPAQVHANWERIKGEEKQRDCALDGVPLSLGALARTQKLLERATRAGIDVPGPVGGELGARLFALVREASAAGLDTESELRRVSGEWEQRVRESQVTAKSGPGS